MTAMLLTLIVAVIGRPGTGGAPSAAGPFVWPAGECRESSLEWTTDEDGVDRARLSGDVDGDGAADTLEASSSGGSGMSGVEIVLSLSSESEPIEVGHEVSFYALFDVMPVPARLLLPQRRRALEAVEDALFGRVCDRADPSLAWLLATRQRLVWIAGAPRMPLSYTVRLSQRRLDALRGGRTVRERAAAAAADGDLWITYRGQMHTAASTVDARAHPRVYPVELARDGSRVLLGTGHGAILTDVSRSRHAWIYVHQDPERAQKLRLARIVNGRLTVTAAEIGVGRFFLGGPGEAGSTAPVPVRVDLRTGQVSHAFDDAHSTALGRHEALCERGLTRECVRRDEVLCERGDATRCFNTAVAYANGEGVPRNPERAHRYFQRACEEGEAEGCAHVGHPHGR